MDNRTEQLAAGVWRVEVGYMTNAFVLAEDGRGDGDGLLVVDTGWRGGGARLVRSVRMLDLDPRAIGTVLLSHWHPDHAGSAAKLARSSASPRVLVGEADLPVVRGEVTRPHRVAPREGVSATGRLADRIGLMRPAEPVAAAGPLRDGDRFGTGGGMEVVAAPGHTPGHCALWLRDRGVLLAGDAVWNTWMRWTGPAMSCSAIPQIPATLRRLAALDPGVLAVAHGPPLTTRPRERLERLAERAAG